MKQSGAPNRASYHLQGVMLADYYSVAETMSPAGGEGRRGGMGGEGRGKEGRGGEGIDSRIAERSDIEARYSTAQ